MVSTEDSRPAFASTMADLRDVPLTEMSALSLNLLERTIGRALPPASVKSVPLVAFQSSI
jgi:FXSXX-COOH protein